MALASLNLEALPGSPLLLRHPRSPLKLDGTPLPVTWLAAAKAVALFLFALGYFGTIGEPYLPLVPVLDDVPGPAWQVVMQASAVAGLVLLLVNVAVRASALMVGIPFALTGLANQTEYLNSVVWASFVLILIGLHRDGRSRELMAFQFVALYVGSFLSKIVDRDWLDGTFIDNWRFGDASIYNAVDDMAGGGLWFPTVIGLTVICVEGLLAVLFARRSTRRAAVGGMRVFHTIPMAMNWLTFGIFYPALAISALTFFDMPARPTEPGLRPLFGTPLPYLLLAFAYAGARAAKAVLLG